MGDPRPATSEKGARWIEQAATRLAAVLEEMARYPDPAHAMSQSGWVDCGEGVRLERGVRARMRDGVELVSDHYYPPQPGPQPTLLMRQPYGRDIASTVVYAHPVWFARHGYNVVIQDVRGRGDSEGEFYPFRNEGADGADTIAWLRDAARIKWPRWNVRFLLSGDDSTTGRGGTARGLAVHLARDGGVRLYHGWFYHGGALQLASTLGWGLQLLKADARRKRLREASDRLEQAWAKLCIANERAAHSRESGLARRRLANICDRLARSRCPG